MITLKSRDTNLMKYEGCIEGFRILPHIYANAVNTALSVVPDYSKVKIEWRCDGVLVYAGDLKTFVQYLFFRSMVSKCCKKMNMLRMQYLNALIGKIINKAASGVYAYTLSDLSVFFTPMYGKHEFSVRTEGVFPTESDASSYILFDFNKSDEIGVEKFVIVNEPVTVASDKGLNVSGLTRCMAWIQGDNEFITTDDGQFNSTGVHPIANMQMNSKYSENMYNGAELQVQDMQTLTGIISYDAVTPDVKNAVLQKSVMLSDEEFIMDANVSLKLNQASMSTSIAYAIVYDLVTFDVTSAKNQIAVANRLNAEHQALMNLHKGIF